jgi:ABC-type Mn2+/Zn2+ transport system ATPase subunit
MKVLLIESQRLLEPEPVGPGRSRPDGQHTTIPAVTAISNDLVGRIGKDKIAYVRQSGEIDRTFPIRFLKAAADTQQAQSASELRARLSELDKKRADLQAVGILEREELLALEIPDEIEDVYVKAFSLLVSDIDHKLNHFDELESKISLLKELANARFQYKKLEVDAERGLYCVAEGRNVPLVQLSSGEQHELVLFYDALFRVEEGSLLMIDEPELSLHAAWQSEFIEDLKRILRLSGVTVLIATHSSALIGGNWDLVVELKGPSSGLHS